jgi:hypothetical protein
VELAALGAALFAGDLLAATFSVDGDVGSLELGALGADGVFVIGRDCATVESGRAL